jgi:YidC/Oxa1 family membrane protein insertase
MPAPGSEAERIFKEKKAARDRAKGIIPEEPLIIEAPRGQRQQPKRKDRNKGPVKPEVAAAQTDQAGGAENSRSDEATASLSSEPKAEASGGASQKGNVGNSGGGSQRRPGGPGSGKKRKKR